MVNYAEEADFIGHKKPKKYLSAAEVKARTDARNAARTSDDWRMFARDIVYRQLAMRDKSVHELRTALNRRSVPEQIAEETISSFVASGLVNDAKFAQAFVRSRFSDRATSRRVLAAELKKRGVNNADADAALEQITSDDEFASARDFALRKARSLRGVKREVVQRRLYGALGRRGFTSEQIRNALQEALMYLEVEQNEDIGEN